MQNLTGFFQDMSEIERARDMSEIRQKMNTYTTVAIMFISAAVFLSVVPFLPATPFIPALVAAGIAALSYKRTMLATRILGVLVFLAIMWQINGFGVRDLLESNLVGIVVLYIMVFIPLLMTGLNKPIAVSLAALAVSLMFTPYFYLSVPMIVVAAFLSDLVGIETLAASFVLYLLPFLLIENALYLTSQDAGNLCVTFAQLTHIGSQLRPPLSGLNIFLADPFPPDYMSLQAANVVQFCSSDAVLVIIVPLALFGVVFSASASIAVLAETLVRKLKMFESLEKPIRLFSPLTIAFVMPVVFYLLLTALAPESIGGYQPPFSGPDGNVSLFAMIVTSVALGSLFVGREFLIQFFERVEFAKKNLNRLLGELGRMLSNDQAMVTRVMKGAPSLDLVSETNTINSWTSTTTDIKNHMSTADYPTLTKWIDSTNQGKTELQNLPEVVRVKLANELSTLSSLISTFNATLEEVGVANVFEDVKGSIREMRIEDALTEYQRIVSNIRETVSILYEKYALTTKAYNELADLEPLLPPVSPVPLLDSYDYFTAMKLICDEYWLNFHMRRRDELTAKAATLQSLNSKLQCQIGVPSNEKFVQYVTFFSMVQPVNSPKILATLGNLKSALLETVMSAENENDKLNAMIKSLMPIATHIVSFESVDQSMKLSDLHNQVAGERASLDGAIKCIDLLLPGLQSYEESRRRDLDRLIIMSQYPFAKRYIKGRLDEKRKLEAAKMPFQRNVSVIYLRLYVAANPSLTYDDELEEIRSA